MSDTPTTHAPPRTVTPEGTLLRDIYSCLVTIHHGFATRALPDPELRRLAMSEIMDVLRQIDGNPQYRAAADAAHEQWLHNPTPAQQAAKERNKATLERFMRAREARLAEAAAASNSASDV